MRLWLKLKRKEAWTKNKDNTKLDNSVLDPSEQMGRPATIVHEVARRKTPMSKSIIPSQEQMRDNDPFIDDKAEDPVKNAFIDPPIDDDDDSFLNAKKDF